MNRLKSRREFLGTGVALSITGTAPAAAPAPLALTDAERMVLNVMRVIGEEDAIGRMTLSGRYQAIWDALEGRCECYKRLAKGGAA